MINENLRHILFSLWVTLEPPFPGWHDIWANGHVARYVKLRIAHAPGMPRKFSPPSRVSDPDMHHGTCVLHVPWCMPGSLTNGFLWSRWRGKRHSRCTYNPQFYVSGKRPVPQDCMSDWDFQKYHPNLTHPVPSTASMTLVCDYERPQHPWPSFTIP